MAYFVGSQPRASVTFTVDGVPTDPTTVVAKVLKPDGTQNNYTYPSALQRDGTGVYHLDVTVDMAGPWWVRFEGTGAAQGAVEASFDVATTRFR